MEKGSNDSLYARYNENWVYDSNLLPTKIGEPNGGEVEKCMQFLYSENQLRDRPCYSTGMTTCKVTEPIAITLYNKADLRGIIKEMDSRFVIVADESSPSSFKISGYSSQQIVYKSGLWKLEDFEGKKFGSKF